MHTPVLCDFVITHFENTEDKVIIDCTLGEGGHTKELAKRGAKMLSIDADELQISNFRNQIAKEKIEFKHEIKVVRGNYADIQEIATANGFSEPYGILFDLGLSMNQLGSGDGFSYKAGHQPLHMVIDTVCKQMGAAGAADVLTYKSENELIRIFEKYGELKNAAEISRKIVNARKSFAISKVGDLMDVLAGIPTNEIAKVFQALRIFVNDEYTAILSGLNGAWNLLKNGGILQVITFHSGEDRVVKLWAKEKMAKQAFKILGKNESKNSFERSATLRVYKK